MPVVQLTVEAIRAAAAQFAVLESEHAEPLLFGITDGKAVGTYLELKFKKYLQKSYAFSEGNAAKGIDFPELNVDIKTTSIKQPQSSCPFKSARQKIYGLGYSVLVFVYEKTDDQTTKTGRLHIHHVIYVLADLTGDYQTTRGIRDILERGGNTDDLLAFIDERRLPVDEVEAGKLAEEIFSNLPKQGYLTISNALQWRLQYGRVIEVAGKVEGVLKVI